MLSAELWAAWHDRVGRDALTWVNALEPGAVRAQILPTAVGGDAARIVRGNFAGGPG